MKIFEQIKIPLVILIVCLIGFFVYKNYFAAPAVGDLTQQTAAQMQARVDAQTDKFRQTLDQLQGITFDTKIFDSQQFQELQDNTVRALERRDAALAANPAGKANPFSSISSSGGVTVDLNGAGSPKAPQTGR